MRAFLAAMTAILLVSPAHAQAAGIDPLLPDVRRVADVTAGQMVGPQGDQAADKVLGIGRNDAGRMIVTGIQALAPGGSNDDIAVTDRAVAIVRTRASTPGGNGAPAPEDFAYVRRTGMRLLIVGEWSRPPAMWEIERDNITVRFRVIDPEGRPGPWQAPAG